jgi:hypothetical protein
VNPPDIADKGLLQRFLDYRNRAEELRAIAENTRDDTAMLMLAVAATHDRTAETLRTVLLHSDSSLP